MPPSSTSCSSRGNTFGSKKREEVPERRRSASPSLSTEASFSSLTPDGEALKPMDSVPLPPYSAVSLLRLNPPFPVRLIAPSHPPFLSFFLRGKKGRRPLSSTPSAASADKLSPHCLPAPPLSLPPSLPSTRYLSALPLQHVDVALVSQQPRHLTVVTWIDPALPPFLPPPSLVSSSAAASTIPLWRLRRLLPPSTPSSTGSSSTYLACPSPRRMSRGMDEEGGEVVQRVLDLEFENMSDCQRAKHRVESARLQSRRETREKVRVWLECYAMVDKEGGVGRREGTRNGKGEGGALRGGIK
ncbi:hypothetical protein Naga_100283g7 [Nannochloropsis gaditana]|uniref:Uncharacterized protein n=1 Tax=Nannochloropsis gaditana TaxID=72520 RepID=W7TBB5_9STRA|nr:hypothetical protein Naga_100283g7 [Nannochloropsis gaditana]